MYSHFVGFVMRRLIFSKTVQIWGLPCVDMFASSLNRQIDQFVSWRRDPDAIAVNGFSLNYIILYCTRTFAHRLKLHLLSMLFVNHSPGDCLGKINGYKEINKAIKVIVLILILIIYGYGTAQVHTQLAKYWTGFAKLCSPPSLVMGSSVELI